MDKKFSASIACAFIVDIRDSIEKLNHSVDFLHIDLMDNHFVKNLGFSYDQIADIRKLSNLPFDFHLMVDNPENVLDKSIIREGDMVSIHIEAVFDFEDMTKKIKDLGARVLLALNPMVPIKCIEIVADLIDGINYLTVNPGFASQVQTDIAKIQAANIGSFIKENKREKFIFEVDGNMTLKNIEIFSSFGANCFVLGTSSIFPNNKLNIDQLREIVKLKDK
ncbi:hypothetical protein KMY16_000265 [Campylobacter coli]|nr:hypothetical protein [Campylobacter coli]EHO8290555.1 hypothetical protein [Campylobacter coli]